MMTSKRKILLIDIETAPNIGYTWGKWEQDVIEFVQQSYLLCFAWKWEGQKKVQAAGLDKHSSEELLAVLHGLLEEADVVVAHNGDQFDIKMMNAYLIANGFAKPSPYKTVDTKKVAKKYFRFNSNKLDDLGATLGIGRKLETGGFSLWKRCMANDAKAWAKMLKYNKQDVALLEEVYIKLRPWMDSHPVAAVQDGLHCEHCGCHDLQLRGFTLNKRGKRQRYQCQGCGAWKSGDLIKNK